MLTFTLGLSLGLMVALAAILAVLGRFVAEDQERFKAWLEGL